jgi:PAS domain S-box-containing protein
MNRKQDRTLNTVSVPDSLRPIFLKAQCYVDEYFREKETDPRRGLIDVSGERYILVRAASMSREFFEMVFSLYRDRGEKEARTVAFGFLFDIAHAIGKADARSFFSKMGLKEPIEKLSAGPVHFAYTGWAYVDIFPESHPTPDEDYYLIYDHPFSFEADTWMKNGDPPDFPVCAMNAGYSSGWCEESFGVPLVAAEIECQAKGDEHCRFIMAPPARIKEYIARYGERYDANSASFGSVDVPEFFQRKRLEDELIKSEETVRALLNAPNDRAMLLDTDGTIKALNNTAADAFGKGIQDLIGKNVYDLLPPPLAERRRYYHDEVVRSGKSARYQDERDGRWLDTTLDPVHDGQGRVARIALFSRDMTRYKRMEDALRKEKEFTATLIKTSPALFVAIAADGRILLMNETMLKSLGYRHSEVVDKNYLSFVHEADWPRLGELFQTPPREGGAMVGEGRMVTKDGQERIVEWHSRHIFDDAGELDYFFALGIDVTERKRAEDELRRHRDHLEDLVKKRTESLSETNVRLQREIGERNQAEQALKKSETMLRAIFDQTFQFVGVLRLNGTIVQVNKTAMDFVGTTESEIIRKPFWETPWWVHSKREQDRLREAISRAARGELVRFETVHPSPGGQLMNIDFSLKPVRDETGNIILLIAEGRDITELKTAVEDLRKREAELEIQSRSLEEANIALRVILKQMEDEKREEKEKILSNVKQLVIPYLNRLKHSRLAKEEMILMKTLENNLNSITSSLVTRLSSSYFDLTPMEIRIANLVKEGLMNKEIADLLGTSLNTVTSHRYRIRSKLGLRNKGVNLRSYLLALD